MVNDTTDSTFHEDIKSGITMVDFWAPWCGPCRMVSPILEELSDEMEDKAKILKMNVDENPQVATQFGITSIPTLIVFKNGEKVDQTLGAAPKDFYVKLLEKQL